MRIAVVIHEYPPLGGGASTAAQATAKAMVEFGHEVLVITAGGQGLPRTQDDDGVRVERLPSLRLRNLAPSAMELLSFCASARLLLTGRLRRFAADGVLAYFAVPAGAFAVLAARRVGVPVVVSLRGSDVPGFAQGRLDSSLGRLAHPVIRRTLRRASAVAPNSRVLEDLAAAFMPELAGAMHVIRNGVDRAMIADRPARSGNQDSPRDRDGPVVIVQLGQLIPRKRVSFTLAAVAALVAKGRDVRLRVIGDGPLRDELDAEVTRLDLHSHVIFEGRLARADVPGALRSGDVFVMTSVAEGMSNALLEAMASGLPVLTTRNGSDDVVTAADAGFVVEADDRAGFEARLDELCTRPGERERLARNGLAYARTMTWQACADGFLELFAELARERRAGTSAGGPARRWRD